MYQSRLYFALRKGGLPDNSRHSRGLSRAYHAHCKSWRTRLKSILGTRASPVRNQSLLIPLKRAPLEAPNAGVVAVIRWIEPQNHGTGVIFLRRSRRVFCRAGEGVSSRGEQSENRSADDQSRRLSATTRATGGVTTFRIGHGRHNPSSSGSLLERVKGRDERLPSPDRNLLIRCSGRGAYNVMHGTFCGVSVEDLERQHLGAGLNETDC